MAGPCLSHCSPRTWLALALAWPGIGLGLAWPCLGHDLAKAPLSCRTLALPLPGLGLAWRSLALAWLRLGLCSAIVHSWLCSGSALARPWPDHGLACCAWPLASHPCWRLGLGVCQGQLAHPLPMSVYVRKCVGLHLVLCVFARAAGCSHNRGTPKDSH